jgi:nicotinamidase-related amidase
MVPGNPAFRFSGHETFALRIAWIPKAAAGAEGTRKFLPQRSRRTNTLKPKPEDIVVEGKRGLDGFATTNLDFILRNRKIETVVLAGFLTNCCVESTMRTAYELGYDVVTLKDCAATVSQIAHENALEHDFPMFSHPMTHDEFLTKLAGSQSEKKEMQSAVG